MNIQMLTEYFIQYGAFFIFLIVFLEYLNLPGFPAGVIMPLAGIWAARGAISFPLARTLISVPAGMIKMNFAKYTISSVCGVFLWNLTFVGAGYFFGEKAIDMFT